MYRVLLAGTLHRQLTHLHKGLLPNYAVQLAGSSADVWRALITETPHVVVLDASEAVNGFDALRLCAELRAAANVPLIVLTRPDQRQDRVSAFRAGVDHCLNTPLTADELSACVESLLLRRHVPAESRATAVVEYADGELRIDLHNHRVWQQGKLAALSEREFLLLARLVKGSGNAVSPSELCRATWPGKTWRERCNILKIYIARLRQKVEPDPKHPRYIVSQRGLGYAFMPHPTGPAQELPRVVPSSALAVN